MEIEDIVAPFARDPKIEVFTELSMLRINKNGVEDRG